MVSHSASSTVQAREEGRQSRKRVSRAENKLSGQE